MKTWFRSPASLRWLLAITSLMLVIGFYAPMMTLTQFMFIDQSFSIVSGIWQLLEARQFGLFTIVALFSIVFPIAKIILLFRLLSPQRRPISSSNKLLNLMHHYGRWGMLDVMVVAILIVTVKLGAIVSIQIHLGLYIFGTAVLLIMFITHRVVDLIEHNDH